MFYLKYRPQTISEIDNSRVKELLKKILEGKSLPHALLFVGQKGSGKTSAARIFAKAVNCLNNRFTPNHPNLPKSPNSFEPCNHCRHCLSISASSFTDVVELDAASNRGIEEIKNLIRETAFLPMVGRYRVFIIDEAHMITPDGFNALLKTLEEPPKSAIFLLATTNLEKLPKTIASRCLKVNFGQGKIEDIINMLKRICQNENLKFKDEFLKLIARHSDHSFRDAAKILEEASIQNIASSSELENYLGIRGRTNLLEVIEKKDMKKTFAWVEEFSQSGGSFKNLIEEILEELRLALLHKKGVLVDEIRSTTLTIKEITKLIKLLMEAYQMLRSTPIDSLPLEIALNEFYNNKYV